MFTSGRMVESWRSAIISPIGNFCLFVTVNISKSCVQYLITAEAVHYPSYL